MLPSIARQAQVPAGATVIPNHHGTAPGLYLPPTSLRRGAGGAGRSPHLFLLPGPPRELRPMFTERCRRRERVGRRRRCTRQCGE